MTEAIERANHLSDLLSRGLDIDYLKKSYEQNNTFCEEQNRRETMDEYFARLNNTLTKEHYSPSDLGESEPPIIPQTEIIPISAASVETRPVNWLWKDVLVQGAVNSIQGIAGIGKSFMLCAIVAAVSTGGTVQSTGEATERVKQGRVLYLPGDDDIATTIVPRLVDMGANLDNVFFPPDGMFPTIGSPELEALFEIVKPSKCVLDTLQHFTPSKVDYNSANSTTRALQPLKRLAEKYDCCIVVIQHISKVAASGNGGHSVNFGIGSSAINGIFRSVWTLGRLKDDEGKPGDIRVLAPSKTNLVPGDPPCILFELSKERGFLWAGTDAELTAEALYDVTKKQTRAAPARAEAERFLKDVLSDGDQLAIVIKGEAEQVGISYETLKDAKKSLGIESKKRDGAWWWISKSAKNSGYNTSGTDGTDGTDAMQESQVCQESHRYFEPNVGTLGSSTQDSQVKRGRI
jgi:putative DNA primase/helicase